MTLALNIAELDPGFEYLKIICFLKRKDTTRKLKTSQDKVVQANQCFENERLIKQFTKRHFISTAEGAQGTGKKLLILFTIMDMTHDMKTFKAHLLNRNILTLKKW